MRKYKVSQKIWAVVLSVVMVLGMLPVSALAVSADAVVRQADPSTMNEYRELFLDPDTIGVELTTENAGGIWTDKSVFSADNIPAELTGAVSEENTKINVTDTGDNFLVTLSAIASNKEIVGYSTRPTDTMLVLDLSGSMQGSTATMVTAANKAIGDLLALNEHNRVGVVLYSGNSSFGNSGTNTATVLMPLGRYTTTSYTGTGTNRVPAYIQSNNERVSVANSVRPNTNLGSSKNTTGGTYTQNGIYKAMNELVNAEDKVIPEGSLQAGTTRLPILVLMTDGQPTAGTKNYTNVGTSDVGEGRENTDYADDIAFLTQLTMAYAKREIETAYGTTSRLYTLGYNVDSSDYAKSVMDPSQYSTSRINTLWNTFMNTAAGKTFTINAMQNQNKTVTKHTDAAGKYTELLEDYRYYTDEYFPAERSSELAAAFQSIVDEIILQAKYYPTYVEKDHDHDGYVTFADKIGAYMEVTAVHGVVIGDTLFSGALLARGLEDGTLFGTVDNPTSLGDNFVWSVKERLGISDTAVARALLQNAYDYGQLSYTSDTEFSNYIGWYSDAAGNYLDFWHEGTTAAAPAGATHIIKSYGMLGQTDTAHGISAADMMYASIRVTTELDDYDNDGIPGETIVTWQIPASLIPTITYKVQVDTNANGQITGVESVELENANVKPIRLLYEVALQEDIHEWNITEKVNDVYRDSTANKDAGYVFYSNQWKKESGTTDTTRNTYSHFEPSIQNEWYYYTDDAIIYTDENGTQYTGSSAPSTSGTYYRAYQVYEKLETGTYRMHTHYEQISAQSLAMAEQSGSNWVIPKGTVFRFWDPFQYTKSDNTTNTHAYSEYPTVVHDDNNDHYYAYDVLGNNGKLTVTPATGIKVTKTVSEYVSGASDTFTFVISGGSGTATLIRLDANGDEASRQTLTFEDGKAEFTLSDKESVYITGLTGGTDYTVTEKGNEHYKVSSVKVNGVAVSGKTAVITAVSQSISSAEFVNSPKGYGNLFITKEVVSDHPVPDGMLGQTFNVTVNVGADLAGQSFTVKATDMVNGGEITTTETVAEDGTILLTIVHGQTYEIVGLPEDTQVTVTETLTDAQSVYFTGTIKTRDHSGAEQDTDNLVTIHKDANATAVLTNAYAPESTTVDLDVVGTKNFVIDQPLTEDVTFTFLVQHWNGSAWEDVATKSVTYAAGESGSKNFAVEDLLSGVTYDKETVDTYQVIERIESVAGVTYDASTHTFTVTVTDVGGQLEAKVTGHHTDSVQEFEGKFTVLPQFTNTYDTVGVTIDVIKNVTDTSANPATSKAGFNFVAVETDENWVAKDGGMTKTEISDGAGEARFTATYKDPGTYYFVITETDAGAAGWTYDATKYYVKVVVTEDDAGDLSAVMEISDGVNTVTYGNSGSISFTNAYDPTDATVDLDIVPTVVKHLQGRALAAGEFTFAVFADGTASHTSTAGAILVGTNDAAGNVDFNGVLTFDKVGTYRYDVVEINGGLGGVTYDTTIYDMVVEVKDVGGKLEASYYFEDAVSNQVSFNNGYDAADTGYVISGTKQLTGRPLVNAEFRFNLTEVTDVTGQTVKTGGVSLTAQSDPDNDKDGITQFAFPAIEYTAAGEYFYLITEENAGSTQLGVTYSSAEYVVKVTVTDNGSGNLVATSSIVSGGDALAFVNTYVPQGTSANLYSSKQLTGRVLVDGEFDFVLTQKTDSTYTTDMVGGAKETVKNDADGKITFSTLYFNTVGDYYYVIEEAAGSAGGVTYDGTKYHIHISVTDNLAGNLVANTSMVKVVTVDGVTTETPATAIEFHNLYTVDGDGELTLEGTKVYNQTLVGGDFSFGLYDHEGNLIETVKNGADGQFVFSKLTYDETDAGNSYTYTVQEILPVVGGTEVSVYEGITYDTAVYTVVVTVSDNGVGGIDVTHTVNGAATPIVFTNNYDITGHDSVVLNGTKTMTGDRTAITAGEFSFGLYNSEGELVEEVSVQADGTFAFSALTFDASHIDQEIIYTVQEILPAVNPTNGITYDTTLFTVQVTVTDNGVGGVDASYTVNGSSHNPIAFTNTYEAAPVDYILEGVKTYTKPLVGNDFTFHLEGQIGSQTVDQAKKNDASGKIVFDKLTFTDAGIYTFTVREIDKALGFISYSTEVYTVKITVKDNGIGHLQVTNVTVTDSNGAAATGILFENTYVLDGEAKITLFGTKTLSGYRTQLQDEEFAFGLYDHEGNLIQTVYNDTLGNFVFDTLVFDETHVGQDISYTVKEILPVVNGAEVTVHEGRTYDTTVYTVDVNVVDNNKGGVEVSYTVNGAAGTPIAFANTYNVAPVDVNLEATKNYNRPLQGNDFTFTLTGEDQNQTKKNDAAGKVVFDKLTFNKAGTYTFQVKEVKDVLGFIQYSSQVYDVTVVVTDNNRGQLVANVTVNGAANGDMVFTNTYVLKGEDEIVLEGSKVYNQTLTGGEFSFELLDENGNLLQTVKNGADGKFAFSALEYTEADAGKTFTYLIEETLPVDEHGHELSIYKGVTYDTTVYTVVVTVSDNGVGGIEATYTVNGGNNAIVFTNNYDITDHDHVTLGGNKVMTGDRTTVAAGEFSFGLYNSLGELVEEVSVQADGTFSFTELTFGKDELGAHAYTVKEIIPSTNPTDGITYDTIVYEVEIHVVDNGEGGVDVSYTVDGSAHNTLTFTNTYEAAPVTVQLEGTKKYDKPLKGDDFTFELTGDGVSQIKKNDASGKILFDKLTFTEAGVYTYTVKETEKVLGFVDYSAEIYTVAITVVDNGKGNLEIHSIEITNVSGTASETIEFVNAYVLTGEGSVVLDGSKIMTGDRTTVAVNEFAFGLFDGEGQLVEKVFNKADGTFSFSELTFGAEDIGRDITYTVKEIIPTSGNPTGGITYDTAVYTVKVTVEDNNEGGVTVTHTVNGGSEAIVFTNKYEANEVKVRLEGTKKYDKPLKGDDFTFELTGEGVSQSKKNDVEGKIVFDELVFTEPGVYTFTVKETNKVLGFIDYSKAEYQIVITVTDNGQGHLVAAVTVNGAEDGKIEFVNTYVLDGEDSIVLRGKKQYNLPLTGTDFKFGLYDNGGNLLQMATADEDGTIDFAPLYYDETHVGNTYTYVVEEILPVDEHGHELNVHYGIHYDTTVYTVEVTVSDNGEGGVSATYTVNGGNNPIVFNNVYAVTGNDNLHLEGVKYLSGDRTELLDGETYTFGLYDAEGNLLETATSDAEGKFAFQNILFGAEDIADAPYIYTVKEIIPDEPAGGITYDTTVYTVEVYVLDDGMGGVEVSHGIKGRSHGHLEFTNIYEAAPVTVQLEGTKKYDKPLKGDDFTFELTGDGVSQTKKNDVEGKILFDELTFTEAGVYTFTVTETNKELGFIDYSKAVYVVTVTVTDNNKGQLEAVVTVNGDAEGKIEFVNTYVLKGEDSIKLEGSKVYNQTLTGGEFSFELLDENGNLLQTVKNDAEGKFAFEALKFTEADAGKTFTYLVEETLPVDEHGHELNLHNGITYDTTVYTVVVTVTDNGVGGIVVAYTINGGNNPIVFTNNYDITGHDTLTLSGNKVMTGDRTTVAAGEFSFELYDAEGNLIETVKNAADGSFAFSELTFTKEHLGLNTFTVKEVKPEGETYGIIYDTTVYTVEVYVLDDGMGGVEVSYAVNGQGHEHLTFTNAYKATSVSVQLEGTKKYDKPLKGDDFTFELAGEGISQTVKNDASGKIVFDKLTFTKAGVYTYTVKEIDKVLGYVDYSDAEHLVNVIVTDNGLGQLEAMVTVNGASDGKIEFVNTYVLKGEDEIVLEGTKVLTGDRTELKEGEFAFGLYDSQGNLLQKVTNDADGKFAFSALIFNENHVGKHTYTVAEVAGFDPNMTYDTTVYTVEVTVTDNGVGGVTVTYTVSGGQILFTNVYTEPDPVQLNIHVLKNMANMSEPGISPEGFEFVLTCGDESITAVSKADGTAGFGVAFDMSHLGRRFELTVTEVKGSQTGVTYDETVHTIIVEVVRGADGTLKTLVNGKEAKDVTVEFTNTYEAPSTPVTGDTFNLPLIMTLMIVSMGGVLMILLSKKQKGGKYAK